MDDLIRRADAIEAVEHITSSMSVCVNTDECHGMKRMQRQAVIELTNMPSAQPEIIRCTECKHYREYDSKYVENAVVVQCMADRYPISETIPDGWFCAGAERKDNG